MSKAIQRSRNGCALHGALNAAKAVERFVPIIHSNAGCGLQRSLAGSRTDCGDGFEIPSTNVSEKQIIFGGTSRLREQIKNTVKVLNGDAYIIVTGCSTEIVGDDVPAMVKEAQEQGFPVISISTPGFRGDAYGGYKMFVKGIIEQLPKLLKNSPSQIQRLVNLIGIVPGQDVFWEGNINELKSLLEALGVKVNTLFGRGQDITGWGKIPDAELNLVISPWGLEIADYLEKKFGTPFIDIGGVPIGPNAVGSMFEKLEERLGLDSSKVREIRQYGEDKFAYYQGRLVNLYFKYDFQKEFVLVGESFLIPWLLKFLHKSLGMIPQAAIITDNPPQFYRDSLKGELDGLGEGYGIQLLYSEDGEEISDLIRKLKPELLLGSSLEETVAAELDIPLLEVSYPIYDSLILKKSYVGVEGAISLIEDLGSEILRFKKQKNKRAWEEFI